MNGDSLKIRVMGSIRYPDAFVTCTSIHRDSKVVYEPVVIFEILSKSTEKTDRKVKNREYAGTASVRRYVILEEMAKKGMMFTRRTDGTANGTASGTDWLSHPLYPDTVLRMPEIGVELPLAALYADLGFSLPLSEE